MDVLASKRLARALMIAFDALPPRDRNLLRYTFLDESCRELSINSQEFRRWWADHNVRERTNGIERYHHPPVGDLTVDYESVALLGPAHPFSPPDS
jgi:hypothetical protein